jgi:hypothetical protein
MRTGPMYLAVPHLMLIVTMREAHPVIYELLSFSMHFLFTVQVYDFSLKLF